MSPRLPSSNVALSRCLPRVLARSLRTAFALSLVLLAAMPHETRAQTLKEALKASWDNNIAFAIERRRVQEQFEVARRAAIDLGPTISLQGNYGLHGQRTIDGGDATDSREFDPQQIWGATVSLDQPVLQNGQVYASYVLASYDRKIALVRLRAFEAQLILDGLQRYLGVVESSAALRVNEKSESQLNEQWQSVSREANFGGASKRDVALAAASLAEARAQTIEVRNSNNAALRAFRDHFGVEVEGDLRTPQDIPQTPDDLQSAREIMLDNNFELRVASLELAKQKKIVRAGRALVFVPQIALKADYTIGQRRTSGMQQSDQVGDSFTAQMIFSYPLRPAYFLSGYRSVLNGLPLARDAVRLAEQNARRALLDAWEALFAKQESERALRETLEARGIVLKSAQRATRLGTGDLDDLLEAERNFAEAERAAIAATSKSLVSQVQLLRVLGTLSPALLGLDVPPRDAKHFSRWGFSVDP